MQTNTLAFWYIVAVVVALTIGFTAGRLDRRDIAKADRKRGDDAIEALRQFVTYAHATGNFPHRLMVEALEILRRWG